MGQMSETSMKILFTVIMVSSFFIPLAFYLLFGPQRFEKRDKESKQP